MTDKPQIDIGDLPQECVYEAAERVVRRHYRRKFAELDEQGHWRSRSFLQADDPAVALAGTVAVAFHIDAGEKPINVYVAMIDGSLELSRRERREAISLTCGAAFDAIVTVQNLMPKIYREALVLYSKAAHGGDV